MTRKHFCATSAAIAIVMGSSLLADPVFQQLPLFQGRPPSEGGAPFFGHDELSNILVGHGSVVSDDFSVEIGAPVVHLRWWGMRSGGPPEHAATRFVVSFASDVPASGSNPFSHPGEVLNSQVLILGAVAPGSGTWIAQIANFSPQILEYNAELKSGKEFNPEPDKVYWLSIIAVDMGFGEGLWYWHNRDYGKFDSFISTAPAVTPGEYLAGTVPTAVGALPVYHFQDDAVSGLADVVFSSTDSSFASVTLSGYTAREYTAGADGPNEIAQFSEDMAFELYTVHFVPEPGSIGAVGLALLMWTRHRRSSRLYCTACSKH